MLPNHAQARGLKGDAFALCFSLFASPGYQACQLSMLFHDNVIFKVHRLGSAYQVQVLCIFSLICWLLRLGRASQRKEAEPRLRGLSPCRQPTGCAEHPAARYVQSRVEDARWMS